MSEKELYYFLADTHLGLRTEGMETRQRRVVEFLESLPKETKGLYLLGDIFDYWYEYKYVIPSGYTRFLGALAKLVDSGVEVHFFNGNHDMWTYRYFQEELGVKVYDKPTTLDIADKKFYLAHGDGLGMNDRGFSFLQFLFKNKIVQWLFSGIHPRWTMALGYAWSRRSRLAKLSVQSEVNKSFSSDAKLFPVYGYVEGLEELSEADYYIVGHYHCPYHSILNKGGEFFILGDWIYDCDYLVFDGDTVKREFYTTKE